MSANNTVECRLEEVEADHDLGALLRAPAPAAPFAAVLLKRPPLTVLGSDDGEVALGGRGAFLDQSEEMEPARKASDRLITWVLSPTFLRPVSALLRHLPTLRLPGGQVLVTRHAEVLEVLDRDQDFGVDLGLVERLEQMSSSPFILGMNRSPAYEQEIALLREVVRPGDLPRIRSMVADHAAQVIDAVRSRGRIDVVRELADPVSGRWAASYFGIYGVSDATLVRWTHDIFRHLSGSSVETAERSAREFSAHLSRLIEERRATMVADKPVPEDADVLTRMLAYPVATLPWLYDDAVRRNLIGLIVPAIDKVVRATTNVINILLRHPEAYRQATQAALAGDTDTVTQYVAEALRFHPNMPLSPRTCLRETTLATGRRGMPRIRQNDKVYAFTLSAMFDKNGFDQPRQFRADRPLKSYLFFSHGIHQCFGRYLALTTTTELVAALLRLPNLRRAPGRAGRVTRVGPTPTHFVVAFDR